MVCDEKGGWKKSKELILGTDLTLGAIKKTRAISQHIDLFV